MAAPVISPASSLFLFLVLAGLGWLGSSAATLDQQLPSLRAPH